MNQESSGTLINKEKLTWNVEKVLKICLSFFIMIFFNYLPAVEPITPLGMKVLGVFIGTVLLISLVDITWPSLLAIILFSFTGVMTVNEAIIGSIGSWVTTLGYQLALIV